MDGGGADPPVLRAGAVLGAGPAVGEGAVVAGGSTVGSACVEVRPGGGVGVFGVGDVGAAGLTGVLAATNVALTVLTL